MPHLIIIAGPNGAGKSTSAPSLLKDALHMALWKQLLEISNEKR